MINANDMSADKDLNELFLIDNTQILEVQEFCTNSSMSHIQVFNFVNDVIKVPPVEIRGKICKTKFVMTSGKNLPKYVFYEVLEKLGFKDYDVKVADEFIACTVYPNNN